jgi:hypothetical protein
VLERERVSEGALAGDADRRGAGDVGLRGGGERERGEQGDRERECAKRDST